MADGKTVVLELGGKKRRPIFTLNAGVEIEERIGLKLHHIMGEGSWVEKLGSLDVGLFRAMRTIVWAGLLAGDPELTEEEVGGWITQDNAGEVIEGFFGLLGATGLGDLAAEITPPPAAPKARAKKRAVEA